MTYHGKMTVGEAAQVRELPGLIISALALGPMANNTYLLRSRNTGEGLLVDAPTGTDELISLIGSEPVTAVLITHGHADHTAGLADLVEATGIEVWCHAADADLLPVTPDRLLNHGDTIELGDVTLQIIHLRGHTDGSIAVAYDDPEGHVHLFTGDSLFPGGVGNTWGDPAKFDSLFADVTARIFDVYDDETWVYPGHGDATALGTERPHLGEWRERGW